MELPKVEDVPRVQIDSLDADKERELLRRLIRKGVLEINPTLDSTGVRYADVEEALGVSDLGEVRAMLEDLERKGVLKSKIADRILICPHCGSPEVHSRYTCPKCSSNAVDLTQLLEHTKCGFIGARNDFIKDHDLVCPRCQASLGAAGSHGRVIGNFYQCEKCNYRFDKPETVHICKRCGQLSTYQEARYVKVLTYAVSDLTVKEFSKDLPVLDNVRKLLTDSGFKVRLRTPVTGVSGVQSTFDIVAEKEQMRLVFDVSVSGDKSDIIALLAKKVDVNPTVTVIVDLSGFEELTNLGRIYGILVFKARADQNVPDGFESFLSSLIPLSVGSGEGIRKS